MLISYYYAHMQSNTINICIQDRLPPVVHILHLIRRIFFMYMFTKVVFPSENPV